MSNIAISVQGISKKYKLYETPQQRLWEALHPLKKKFHRDFWALKDVNFEILKGQTCGIVGRNGSGKSTLLQIISGVLRQTSGQVTVNGRVSALLELGTGFNPQFTGHDNVMFYGTLMGFSRAEMKQKMSEIKNFADIGEFFDQPVKIYSSGMFVRLAFAAAIHVNPDVLIVDEALAVGDAKFQHKCYQKFLEFQEMGKTIVFVTHDINAIVKHCDSAILLENGSVLKIGHPKDVANIYYEILFSGNFNIQEKVVENEKPNESIPSIIEISQINQFLKDFHFDDRCRKRNSYNKNEYRFGDKRAEIIDYAVTCDSSFDPTSIYSGDTIDIYLKIRFHEAVVFPLYGFSIKTIDGVVVYATNTRLTNTPVRSVEKNECIVYRFSIKANLKNGDFFIDLGVAEKSTGADIIMDVRYSLIHLIVQEKNRFDGFAELEMTSEEIRKS